MIAEDVQDDRCPAPVTNGQMHRPDSGPPARPHTQRERVLEALRRAGDRGLTQVDWLRPDVWDGGPPVVRLPARIDELRAAGHHIEHAGRRNRCVVYRLVETHSVRRHDHAALAGREPQLGLSAEHRWGELLGPAGTGRPAGNVAGSNVSGLADRSARHKARQVAAVPEPELDEFLQRDDQSALFGTAVGAAPPRSALDPEAA